LFQEALNIRTNLLGAEHPKIAASLFNLGYVRMGQERFPEAERFFRQSLTMRRKLLGNDHLEVAQTLSALSCALYIQERVAESESTVREALGIQARLSSAEPIWDTELTQVRFGVALYLQHRLNEAEVVLRQAVKSYREVLGTEHLDLVEALRILARVLLEKGHLTEAETLTREAILISTKLLGAQSPNTAVCLDVLGSTLRKAGKLGEAEKTFRQELAMWEALAIAPDNKALARSLLIAVLREQGKLAEADQLEAAILNSDTSSVSERILALRNRIDLSGRRGKWKEAAADLARLVELDQSSVHDHLQLAALLVETGDLEAYRVHCRKTLSRFTGTNDDAGVLDQAAKACLLVRDSVPELERAFQVVGQAVTVGKDHAWFSFLQMDHGLAQYRRGQHASAVDLMRQVIGQPMNVGRPGAVWERDVAAYSVLAMAHHQLRQADEARVALARASELAQTKLPQLGREDLEQDWVDWLIAHILLREAKALVDGEPKAAG
jgi:tetratricopeptide (TPR) repeat protein